MFAEYLVVKGVPFREAHGVVGSLVAKAEAKGVELADLSLAEMRSECPKILKDIYNSLGAEQIVKQYRSEGSAGPKQTRKRIRYWAKRLDLE